MVSIVDCHPGGPSSIPGAPKSDIFASQKRRQIKLQHGTPEAVTFFARFRDYKQFGCGWFKAATYYSGIVTYLESFSCNLL